MKLGMPGVTAHSRSSFTPNSVKWKVSGSASAGTSVLTPSLRIWVLMLYSRSTCSSDQVVM